MSKNLIQSWEEENQKNIDTEEGKYTQLCVWPATILGDNTPEQFEQFIKEEFNDTRAKFTEEVITNPANGEKGGRHDLFFYIHNDDLGKFAVKRLSYGIRW